ncbi:CMRF35-like molecule 5 isoform X1 [Odocoileus virginianus]|uniref:CMRF35-like molecule 5 isoform X1 n=1 Tax=Odocoileus virginianus TaxID=9874 RepID=A0ABM4J7R8_ODOVR
MHLLLLFCLFLQLSGSSAISGPRAVRGVEQASLTVRCRYDPGYESYLKWWCRGADWGSCRIMVKTTESEKEVKKGRVSIKDDWKDRSLTVTMEKLRLDDSDTYWCGIEKFGTDLGNRVEVTIDPGSSAISGPRAVRGVEQASLTVRCRYDPGYESYLKWWCRGADLGSCRIMVKTTGSEKEVKKGRVSIKDDRKDRSFTVTMEKLRLDDSDTYWCGIERVGTDLGNRVEVTIDPGSSAISGPRAVRGVEQASLTVRCRYDPGYESYLKWWCRGADWGSCRFMVKTTGSEKEVKKGRVSIKDDQKVRSFTVTMEKLRLDYSDTYWCGIERVGTDLGNRVEVTIDPAPTVSIPTPATSTPATSTPATSTPATSNANMLTAPVAPEENQGQLSLLGSVHFLLLVFLKVPLLLGLLGAVLWVNRPLRSSGWKPQENQQPPWSSTLSREKDPQTEEKGIFLKQ